MPTCTYRACARDDSDFLPGRDQGHGTSPSSSESTSHPSCFSILATGRRPESSKDARGHCDKMSLKATFLLRVPSLPILPTVMLMSPWPLLSRLYGVLPGGCCSRRGQRQWRLCTSQIRCRSSADQFGDSLRLKVGSTLGDRHARHAHAQKRAPERQDAEIPRAHSHLSKRSPFAAKAQGSEVGSRTNLLQGDHRRVAFLRIRGLLASCRDLGCAEGADWAAQARGRTPT